MNLLNANSEAKNGSQNSCYHQLGALMSDERTINKHKINESLNSHEISQGIKFDFKNKRALICGSSQGIGEAIAHELARGGAEIILLARNSEKLQTLKDQLPRNHNQNHQFIAIDLSQTKLVEDIFCGLSNNKYSSMIHESPISIVVNNAGGPKSGLLLDAEFNDFLQSFQTHILASTIIAKSLVPKMKEQKFGRFINIISTSVKTPIPNLGVSNTIRGAMANWSKSLSNELAPFGITVNNILPGYTDTPRLESLALAAAQKQNKTVDEIKSQWKNATPAGRFAQPEEVAFAVAFLASPNAGFITGINLPVDGGRTPCL